MAATHIESTIYTVLSERFTQMEKLSHILSLALVTDMSLILYGRGGFGKSEQLERFLGALEAEHITIQCNSETRVADLFGGSAAETTVAGVSKSKDGVKEVHTTRESYFFSRGVTDVPYIILEEMADSSVDVMAALKAVMTNKEYNGHRSINRVIIGATNKSPKEILKEMPFANDKNTFEALLQRFLVVPHEWDDYGFEHYSELIDKIIERTSSVRTENVRITEADLHAAKEAVARIVIPEEIKEYIAIAAQAMPTQLRTTIPPRGIALALELLRAEAWLQGREEVTEDDFHILQYLEMCAGFTHPDIQKIVQKERETLTAKIALVRLRKQAAAAAHLDAPDLIPAYQAILDEVQVLKVPNAAHPDKTTLANQLSSAISSAKKEVAKRNKAEKTTKKK